MLKAFHHDRGVAQKLASNAKLLFVSIFDMIPIQHKFAFTVVWTTFVKTAVYILSVSTAATLGMEESVTVSKQLFCQLGCTFLVHRV